MPRLVLSTLPGAGAAATGATGMSAVVVMTLTILYVVPGSVEGHGSLVHPRPRNSIDYLAGVNTQWCANITGDKCNNG
jgi:hypothetical protein